MPNSYKIRGIEPSDLRTWPDSVRKMYWGWVVEFGIKRKDHELAQGLDKDGKPLRPISPETRKHRRSAMTPSGKGDPHAPPLTPGHHKSRTRSLLAGRALTTHAEFYWRYDAWTGASWSEVLTYQAKQGRDVFGLSKAGTEWVRIKANARWELWKTGNHHAGALDRKKAIAAATSKPARILAVGGFDDRYATAGASLNQAGPLKPGQFSGFMTAERWGAHFRAPSSAAVPFRPAPRTPPHSTTGAGNNRLLSHVWGQGGRGSGGGPPKPGSAFGGGTPKAPAPIATAIDNLFRALKSMK